MFVSKGDSIMIIASVCRTRAHIVALHIYFMQHKFCGTIYCTTKVVSTSIGVQACITESYTLLPVPIKSGYITWQGRAYIIQLTYSFLNSSHRNSMDKNDVMVGCLPHTWTHVWWCFITVTSHESHAVWNQRCWTICSTVCFYWH